MQEFSYFQYYVFKKCNYFLYSIRMQLFVKKESKLMCCFIVLKDNLNMCKLSAILSQLNLFGRGNLILIHCFSPKEFLQLIVFFIFYSLFSGNVLWSQYQLYTDSILYFYALPEYNLLISVTKTQKKTLHSFKFSYTFLFFSLE